MDYSKLMIGDLVNYSGNDPAAWTIKSFSAGIKNIFNMQIASHTGVVCKMSDQLLVAGMRVKIAIESLDNRDIISIMRHPAINDKIRDVLNEEIAHGVRKSLDYDWQGIFEFAIPAVKQIDSKYYCSEYYKALTDKYITYTKAKVTPYDLQTMAGFEIVWKK